MLEPRWHLNLALSSDPGQERVPASHQRRIGDPHPDASCGLCRGRFAAQLPRAEQSLLVRGNRDCTDPGARRVTGRRPRQPNPDPRIAANSFGSAGDHLQNLLLAGPQQPPKRRRQHGLQPTCQSRENRGGQQQHGICSGPAHPTPKRGGHRRKKPQSQPHGSDLELEHDQESGADHRRPGRTQSPRADMMRTRNRGEVPHQADRHKASNDPARRISPWCLETPVGPDE